MSNDKPRTTDAIKKWIDRGEIHDFDKPNDDYTLMGRGYCNGDCHTCSDLNQCALDFNQDERDDEPTETNECC